MIVSTSLPQRRPGAGANAPATVTCQPGFAPAWTFVPPVVTATGLPAAPGAPLPQPEDGGYILVPGYTYRGVVGVFGILAKGAAGVAKVVSEAAGLGFTNVQAWASPQDAGFPSDWTSPATAASIGTDDDVYYVQGTYAGSAQTTIPAQKSTAGQGAEVWEAFVWSCQGAGAPQTVPVIHASPTGVNWAVVVGISIAVLTAAGLAWDVWKHHESHGKP